MKTNQNGFSVTAVLAFIIVVGAIVTASWYVSQNSSSTDGIKTSSEVTTKYVNQGPGMSPTLSDGQEIFGVEKAASDVKRGDIIVFKPAITETERFVKRVIGLPGDVVTVENGSISVTTSDGSIYNPNLTGASPQQKISKTVTTDSFFVVGDNLNNSLDSRMETFGLVPFDNLISVIVL